MYMDKLGTLYVPFRELISNVLWRLHLTHKEERRSRCLPALVVTSGCYILYHYHGEDTH